MSNAFYPWYCNGVSTLGHRVRAVRKSLKLNQEKFAELCGMHRQTIAQMELDKQYPTVEKLFAVAEATGKPMEYFVTGSYTKHEIEELREATRMAEQAVGMFQDMAQKLRVLSGESARQAPGKVVELPTRGAADWKTAATGGNKEGAEQVEESSTAWREEKENEDTGGDG